MAYHSLEPRMRALIRDDVEDPSPNDRQEYVSSAGFDITNFSL